MLESAQGRRRSLDRKRFPGDGYAAWAISTMSERTLCAWMLQSAPSLGISHGAKSNGSLDLAAPERAAYLVSGGTVMEQFAEPTQMSSEESITFTSLRQRANPLQPLNGDASQIHLSSDAWERHSADTENRLQVGQRFRHCEADPCALLEACEFLCA